MAYRTNGSSALSGDYRDSERPNLRVVDSDNPAQKTTDNIINLDERRKQKENAKKALRDSEENAADNSVTDVNDNDATDQARAAEAGDDAGFVNNVSSRDNGDQGETKKGFGLLRAKSSIIAILMTLMGGGAFIVGSQSMMPFSLLEQLRTKFDSITTSMNLRTNTLFIRQLNKGNITNPLARKYFGLGGETYKVSNKQKQKLAAQGIDVEDMEIDGKKMTVMLFDDGSGGRKVIAADEASAGKIRNFFNNMTADVGDSFEYKSDGTASLIKKMNINGKDIQVNVSEVGDFRAKFETSADFRNGYISGSRTWRGAVGAWFDSIAYDFINSNKLFRNRFKNFRERVEAEQNGNTRSVANSIISDTTRSVSMSGGEQNGLRDSVSEPGDVEGGAVHNDDGGDSDKWYKWVYDYDEDGKITGQHKKFIPKRRVVSTTGSVDINAKAKAEEIMGNIRSSTTAKVTSIGSGVANAACAISDFVGTVFLVVAAQEALQVIQLASTYFESIDKTKAGDGADAPTTDFANNLTTPGVVADDNGNIVREGTSAMQSAGLVGIYSGQLVDPTDASVENFAIGSRFATLLGALTASITSFTVCAASKMTAAIAGMAMDLASIISCIVGVAAAVGTAGASTAACAGVVSQIGGAIAFSLFVQAAITTATEILMPIFTKTLTRDLVTDIAGEDLGNALVSGANVYMGENHKKGGGGPGSAAMYVAFRAEQEKVDAEYARYQRETLSPFDMSSQYTFMGSLAKQLITLSTMTSAPTNIISTMGNMVSNSIVALLPSATAVELSSDIIPNYEQYCPYLASIDVVGDAYCNPYIMTDVSTIAIDPEVVVEKLQNENQIDNNGIVADSELDKYVRYCSNRSSAFGIADKNFANSFTGGNISTHVSGDNKIGSTAASVADTVIGVVPVIGDSIDIYNNEKQLENMGWIDGQNCAIASSNSRWSEMSYYQRYVEDQRLLESVEEGYTSTVTLRMREYYQENPLDDSYEGILARYSGLPKDTVVAVLDYAKYWNYIANYDASSRKDFTAPEIEEPDTIYIDGDREAPTEFLGLNTIVYADLRTRAGITA